MKRLPLVKDRTTETSAKITKIDWNTPNIFLNGFQNAKN